MKVRTTSETRIWNEKLVAKVNGSLRGNPVRWAGIAVGAGLGAGLLGRFLRHRARSRRMPAIVIIESAT